MSRCSAGKKDYRFVVWSNDLSLAMKRPMKDHTGHTCFRISRTSVNFNRVIDEEHFKKPSVNYTPLTVYVLAEREEE
jgi:hypothetical protein